MKRNGLPEGIGECRSRKIQRLQAEGVPAVPTFIRGGDSDSHDDQKPQSSRRDLLAEPSRATVRAAEKAVISDRELTVKKNRLEGLKVKKEATELGDYFTARERCRLEEQAAERQRRIAEEALATTQKRRHEFEAEWLQWALTRKPWDAPQDVLLEIHAEVIATLAKLDPGEDSRTVQRMVEAGVALALKPWTDSKERDDAVKKACDGLPMDMSNPFISDPAWRERAQGIASTAIRAVHPGATPAEMETAGMVALRPLIAEFEHHKKCQRQIKLISVQGANWKERDAAAEAVREALQALPIGASEGQLERATSEALAGVRALIAARLQQQANQERRDRAEWLVKLYIDHVERYLEQEFEFRGGHSELARERDRLQPLISNALIKELIDDPEMNAADIIRTRIEEMVDDLL